MEAARDAWLDALARSAAAYFLHETDRETGLVRDCTREGAPASIAGSGFALTCYAIAAERGYLARQTAAERALHALRFLWSAPQGGGVDAIGAHGFFYHFLDMASGRRVWNCEVSTIDSAILFAGALVAAAYFDGDAAPERELRHLADAIYRRADWEWALNGGPLVSLGWRPRRGFLRYTWGGYSEALMLYVLGLGSPTHPLPASSYAAWCGGYRWTTLHGLDLLHAGPFFIHHLSHGWIDFRSIQDAFMRERGSDYFENSRRATYVQREYARDNPGGFAGYGGDCWGITASDGPGPGRRRVAGVPRRFWHYRARGVPDGPDDGTISPWSLVASLPFAPELVIPSIEAVLARYPGVRQAYGFTCSFNPTWTAARGAAGGWVSPVHYAINQGPAALMIENFRSELVWRLLRGSPYVVEGLRRAGFQGGWLTADPEARAGPRRPLAARPRPAQITRRG